MANKIRPAAVPLITVDPFFSIWSCADSLTEDVTRHWTEVPQPLLAGVYIDGRYYSICGVDSNFKPFRDKLYQTNLEVTPLTTSYTFENVDVKVKLDFTTPLLLDRLDILARPVSYVAYEIEKKSDKNIRFVFGISARSCAKDCNQTVEFKRTPYSLACGNTVQNPFTEPNDMVTIDYGYLHLCDSDAFAAVCKDWNIAKQPVNRTYNAFGEMPYLVVEKTEQKGVITLAYDEIKPIEYFGKELDECYKEDFADFGEMVSAAVSEYASIKELCDKFDKELSAEAEAHGENYSEILSLAYRQAIASHKLVRDENGKFLFLSKECGSGGFIATLDVTYPSIPLFLRYNPELVLGMLRPIVEFAKSDLWNFDFVPHDVGMYPVVNRQLYSMDLKFQMPVEEAGNMLLCLAAVKKYSGKTPDLFTENAPLMKKWADYLAENGYDPGEQLCTDDFAGHLNHNCNLSLKAILALAAYADLSGDMSYMNMAKDYAAKWEIDAKAPHGATKLAFDGNDGWSLKYNMVWDRILGYSLFSDEVKKNEIKHYASKLNRYGVPLDSRADYTKLDWLVWSACIAEDAEYFNSVCDAIVKMINETHDRVPLTDWYFTSTAQHREFQNRTVVAGAFIKLL